MAFGKQLQLTSLEILESLRRSWQPVPALFGRDNPCPALLLGRKPVGKKPFPQQVECLNVTCGFHQQQ